MEAGARMADVAKVPYEQVRGGQDQDHLRSLAERGQREEAELLERLEEVRAVLRAAHRGLEALNQPVDVNVDDADETVDGVLRDEAHEAMLRGKAELAESELRHLRSRAEECERVHESCVAGLKALDASRRDGGAG